MRARFQGILICFNVLLLTGSAFAGISKMTRVSGVVTSRLLDKQFISVRDQYGQQFKLPKRLLLPGRIPTIGSKVNVSIPVSEFEKLEFYKK